MELPDLDLSHLDMNAILNNAPVLRCNVDAQECCAGRAFEEANGQREEGPVAVHNAENEENGECSIVLAECDVYPACPAVIDCANSSNPTHSSGM